MNDLALVLWALVVVPLGTTRAMQIFLWDRITKKPREWALRRFNPEGYDMGDPRRGYLSYLLECPWCSSVWIGLAVAAGLYIGSTRIVTLLVLTGLSASLAAVVLDRMIDASKISDEAIAAREAREKAQAAAQTAFTGPPPAPPAVEMAFEQATSTPPGS
jgi:hypothetical protein